MSSLHIPSGPAAMQAYNTAEWLQEDTTEQKMYAIDSIALRSCVSKVMELR
jgi:hypothetical protein